MAVGGRAGCPRIGEPVITPADAQFDNVNVVFVATAQAVVRRRWIVAELLDFEHPSAVEDGERVVDVVWDAVGVSVLRRDRVASLGIVVDAKVSRWREEIVLGVRSVFH